MSKRPLDEWLRDDSPPSDNDHDDGHDDGHGDDHDDDHDDGHDDGHALAKGLVIETIKQAYDHVRARALPKGATLFSENGIRESMLQLESSGSSTRQLAGVRRMIYTLLPANHRRRLFFEMASSQEGLLRLRVCFGAPPYAFLHPSDIYALNAGAIGLRRTHLSYEYGSPIPPCGQVGHVLQDHAGNHYAIVPHSRDATDASLLPLIHALTQGVVAHFTLQLYLKQGRQIQSPRHDLELYESFYHWNIRGRAPRVLLRVKILAVHTSGARRRTAVLTTRLLSASTDDTYTGDVAKRRRPLNASAQSVESPNSRLQAKPERGSTSTDNVPPMPEFVTVG